MTDHTTIYAASKIAELFNLGVALSNFEFFLFDLMHGRFILSGFMLALCAVSMCFVGVVQNNRARYTRESLRFRSVLSGAESIYDPSNPLVPRVIRL